jgi:hypothetical protein
MADDFILERPFHFIVVVWGARFRNYFLDYCLSSLLAPGNIPALRTREPSLFLIATRPDDWAAMQEHVAFRAIANHCRPVFLEIPSCPPGRDAREHMGLGHKLACERAYVDRAYGVSLTPDCMLSDGTVAALQAHAAAGIKLVLAAALRFGEAPFFERLAENGGLARDRRDRAPLVISGRQMADAAVNGLHPETQGYEWDAPRFPPFFSGVPAAAWWRVRGENGILLHSLSWAPLLMDYAAVARHDATTFDTWTLDGDYAFNNFRDTDAIHIVTDSDEMFIASWGPVFEMPFAEKDGPLLGRVGKGALFRFAFQGHYGPGFDPLKRRIFFEPVRWHGGALNGAWRTAEDEAHRVIAAYVEPPGAPRRLMRRLWETFLFAAALVECSRLIAFWLDVHGKRIWPLLRGDRTQWRWALWVGRRAAARLMGRRFDMPRPDVPPPNAAAE